MKDKRTRAEEEKIRKEHDAAKIEEAMEKIKKLRTLCRENTRGIPFVSLSIFDGD